MAKIYAFIRKKIEKNVLMYLTYNGQLEDLADLGAGGHLALEGAGVCGVRELQLQCILSSSEMLLFSNCTQF